MAFQLGPHSWWVVCQSLKLEREQRWRQPVLSAQPLSRPCETTASMKPKVGLSHQEVQDNSNFFHGKQMPGTVPSTPSNGIPTSTCRGGGHYPLYRYMKVRSLVQGHKANFSLHKAGAPLQETTLPSTVFPEAKQSKGSCSHSFFCLPLSISNF